MHWYQSAVTSTASILFNHNPFSYNGIFIVFSLSSTSFFVCLSVSVVFVDRCIHFPEWTALKIIVNLHLLTGETIVWDNVRRQTSTVHYYGFLSLWNVEIVCVLGIVIVLHPPMPKTQTNHWKVFNSFGRFSLLIFIYNFEGKLYLSVLFLEFLMIYLVPYWAWSDSFDVSIDIDFDFIVMKCNIKCCRWIGMFFS